MRTIAGCLAGWLCLAPGCSTSPRTEATAPAPGSRDERWEADLRFLAAELPERHKNLYVHLPREDFERRVEELAEAIPRLSDVEVRAELAALVASAADIHTTIDALGEGGRFPLELYVFPEGIFVTAAPADHSPLVGARLIGIGDARVDEVRERLLRFIPMESPYAPASQLPRFLVSADALEATRVLSEPGAAEYRFEKNGRRLAVRLEARPAGEVPPLSGPFAAAGVEPPLYLRDMHLNYWFRYLEPSRVLYLKYNACAEMKSLPFAEFTERVMRVVDGRPVEKFIVDLRHNGGGATGVVNPLLAALDSRRALADEGRTFALIDRDSYSSAYIVAWVLKDNYHATLVGEPTAQKPNSYGDARYFTLPHSRLRVRYSTKRFDLVPGDPPSLMPDREIALTARDYFGGRDPVLEAILGKGAPDSPETTRPE